MTDVESKTPNKRKSFQKRQTPKKQKVDISNPESLKNQTSLTNKQKTPQKANKKGEQKNLQKKIKPFAGTSTIQPANLKKNVEGDKINKLETGKTPGKPKRKRNFCQSIRTKVATGNVTEDDINAIEDKIKSFSSRGQLTKTGKRKLKILISIKNKLEGKTSKQIQKHEQKAPDTKSVSGQRREKKNAKNAILQSNTEIKVTQAKKGETLAVNKKGPSKTNGNPVKTVQSVGKNKLQTKVEDDDESESEENELEEAEEESEENESDEGEDEGDEEEDTLAEEELDEEDSNDEVEGEDDGEEDDDDSENEDEDEESDEDEEPAPQVKSKSKEVTPIKKPKLKKQKLNQAQEVESEENKEVTKKKIVDLEALKKLNLISTNQKRFVVFVGNIPYDTTKQDLLQHFQKCGEIKDIRIPTDKNMSKPRGFAYVEVGNEETYQKCLSIHHSFLKGRRINVLYTQGGKKKGEDKKKEMKVKNFKLGAMRKQGQLAGSKKQNQKRSFRRAKQRIRQKESYSNEVANVD